MASVDRKLDHVGASALISAATIEIFERSSRLEQIGGVPSPTKKFVEAIEQSFGPTSGLGPANRVRITFVCMTECRSPSQLSDQRPKTAGYLAGLLQSRGRQELLWWRLTCAIQREANGEGKIVADFENGVSKATLAPNQVSYLLLDFRHIRSGLERHIVLLILCRQCADTSSWRTNAPESLMRPCSPFPLGHAATHREAERSPRRQDQKDRLAQSTPLPRCRNPGRFPGLANFPRRRVPVPAGQ